jgi:signal transduction histidine kinase
LHLSRKLADRLGARIACESEIGRGSRFTPRFERRLAAGDGPPR